MCPLHTIQSLGGRGRCCPFQQPLLELRRVSCLIHWTWVATYSSHPLSGWWNSTLHFPCNPSVTRWLSQLVYDTGYTPHARSKLRSFLGLISLRNKLRMKQSTPKAQLNPAPHLTATQTQSPSARTAELLNLLPPLNYLQLSVPPSRPPLAGRCCGVGQTSSPHPGHC